MTITKRTVLQRIDNLGGGSFKAVIRMIVLEDAAVLGSRTHHLIISPEMDVTDRIAQVAQQFAAIEVPFPSELLGLGLDERPQTVAYPPLDAKAETKIRAAADEHRTPEVMKALADHQAAEAKAAAEAEAKRIAAEQERADADAARLDAAVEKAMDRMARGILFDGKNKP